MKEKIIDYMKKIITKENIIIMLFIFLFTSIFMFNRYAVDTYYYEGYGAIFNATSVYLKDGRLMMVLFLILFSKIGFTAIQIKYISYLLAILCIGISIIYFKNLLIKEGIKKKYAIVISLLIAFNFFLGEYFLFPEYTGIQCLAFLTSILTAGNIVDYMRDKKKKSLILSATFGIISAMSYQGCISMIVICSVGFTLKYSKKISTFILNNILCGSCYLVAAASSFIVAKLLSSSRTSEGFTIFKNIPKVLNGELSLSIGTSNFLPKYLFLIILLIWLVILITNIIKQKNKDKLCKSLFFVYVIVISILSVIVPHLAVNYDSIWIVARSNVGLACILGLMILLYFQYLKKNKYVDTIAVITLVIILIPQFLSWNKFGVDQIKINAVSQVELNNISEKIHTYERQEKKKVNKVTMYFDKEPTYCLNNIKCEKDMNVRPGAIDWAILAYLKKGQEYKSYEDKNFEKYCKNNQWTEFDSEQIQFEDNKLKICIY